MWFEWAVVKICSIQTWVIIARVLELLTQKMKSQWNHEIVGFVWPYKQWHMFRHHVWAQNNLHTSLFSIIITIRSPSITQKNTVFAMLNAGHSAHSTVSTASIHTPTIFRHHFKSILSFKSPLVINYPGFPLAILDIPFTISPFEGQKMLFRWSNPSAISSTSPLLQSSLPPHKKSLA